MCLAALAWFPGRSTELLLIANRDEWKSRPTSALARWSEGPVWAGRDLVSGGTWLGISRPEGREELRWALVTNIRQPAARSEQARSRGWLVRDYLLAQVSPCLYLEQLREETVHYQGFNLLAGLSTNTGGELAFLNSQEGQVRPLGPGVYGLSNASLDTPWPKLVRAKQGLRHALAERDPERQEKRLFRLLNHDQPAPAHLLPATGVPLAWERRLSAIYIRGEDYGTRASSILRLERHAGGLAAHFVERSHDPSGGERRLSLNTPKLPR